MRFQKAFVGLGSNQGDRLEMLIRALKQLDADPKTQVSVVSPFYETQAVGGPEGQGDYVNAVARLSTEREPRELLRLFLSIENLLGRKREVEWGPRVIDLDLLLYGSQIIEERDLVVPHVHLASRRFVLAPLADVAGHVLHPQQGQSIDQLLASCSTSGWVRQMESVTWSA